MEGHINYINDLVERIDTGDITRNELTSRLLLYIGYLQDGHMLPAKQKQLPIFDQDDADIERAKTVWQKG